MEIKIKSQNLKQHYKSINSKIKRNYKYCKNTYKYFTLFITKNCITIIVKPVTKYNKPISEVVIPNPSK